jgi:rare lipoprotein A
VVPDASEVITAEELATIPDPVPGAPAEPPVDAAPREPAATSGDAPASGGETAWIWRVQIFASPDRAQAERTAREASERLGQPYVLDRENSLYKVRLGAFASESEAEPLKRRAVIEGYSGAFRVRTASR